MLWRVTVTRDGRSFSFDYHGSHKDAQAFKTLTPKTAKARREVFEGMPHDILCCIRCDYYVTESEPEDFGLNSDSIKDVAKWNEIREHSKQLRNVLRLSDEELESLPS